MSKKHRNRSQRRRLITVPIHGIRVSVPAELDVTAHPAEAEIRLLADAIMQTAVKRQDGAHKEQAPQSGPIESWLKALAVIATNVWRAKGKMVDPDTGEALDEMKRPYRHVEAIIDALKQIDVEITDPVGRTYDVGMALKVVATEPTPGLSKDTIKETIRPTVLWQGRFLQVGEVIVGTPQASS